jgi:hypothetical protein
VFDSRDPRASLRPTAAPAASAPRPAELAAFHELEPGDATELVRTWYVRGQHFVLAYSETQDGARLVLDGQTSEHAVILPDPGPGAEVTCDGAVTQVPGFSICFVPPGDSTVRMPAGGRLVRLLLADTDGTAAKAVNAASYEQPNPAVRAFEPWPDPAGEPGVRVYSLDVAPEEGRFGRIFRCTTFMVNYLEPSDGPRDPSRLSPHSHDDFEQCSVALEGEFVHHLRWPWTADMGDWREDAHVACGSPSAMIIPPTVIHTTQAVGAGRNVLIDVFCPPRQDFSEKPGWVLNAADYPMPGQAADAAVEATGSAR